MPGKKRFGRPRKSSNGVRKNLLCIRVTNQELLELRKRKKEEQSTMGDKLSITDFVRIRLGLDR